MTISPRISISCHVVPVARLSESDTTEMFLLFEKYYDGVTKEKFLVDLSEKQDVFLFYAHGSGQRTLAGFSTIFLRKLSLPKLGLKAFFVFSGDTVIEEAFWNRKFLQRQFFTYVYSARLRNPAIPLYWMLMSKGHKTYLMMRKNFPTSYPNSLGPTPPNIQAMNDFFYSQKFGNAYDHKTGLISFEDSGGAVKPQFGFAQAKIGSDLDSSFFNLRNPDYAKGIELACIADIQFRHFFPLIWKQVLKPRLWRNASRKRQSY